MSLQLLAVRTARYFATGPRATLLLSQWVTTIMIMIHCGLAMALGFASLDRFVSDSFSPLMDLTGQKPWLAAVIYVTSAALMALPFKWINVAGNWLGMMANIVFAGMFGVAMVNSPTAASTAFPVYAGLAAICAALLTARVIEKPLPLAE